MPQLTFYTGYFSFLDGYLNNFLSARVVAVIAFISPVATAMMAIYVILWGISMIRGSIHEPVWDGIIRILKIVTITGIALNAGNYNTYLANFLTNGADELSTTLINGSNVQSESQQTQVLDTALTKGYNAGQAAWQAGGLSDMGDIFIALLIWLSTFGATVIAGIMIALSKIVLTILVAVGPIFIVCTMFDATKKFFDAWIAQCLNYLLLEVLVIAVLTLLIQIFDAFADNATAKTTPSTEDMAYLLLSATFIFVIILHVPQIAAALASGVALAISNGVGRVLTNGGSRLGSATFAATPVGRHLTERRVARMQRIQDAARQRNQQAGRFSSTTGRR